VESFTPRPLYLLRKRALYPQDRRLSLCSIEMLKRIKNVIDITICALWGSYALMMS
jgi:hypothetical protein